MNNTKQKILDVALNLFAEKGFAESSIRHIAREVGIRESAIYNHFKSKDDILKALMEIRNSKSISEKILNDELLNELSKPQSFFYKFAKKLIDFWNTEEETKFFRMISMEQFRKINGENIISDKYLSDVKTILETIFDEMIKHKVVKKLELNLLVGEFLSPLHLIRLEFLTGKESFRNKKITKKIESHVDFFWNSIKLSEN